MVHLLATDLANPMLQRGNDMINSKQFIWLKIIALMMLISFAVSSPLYAQSFNDENRPSLKFSACYIFFGGSINWVSGDGTGELRSVGGGNIGASLGVKRGDSPISIDLGYRYFDRGYRVDYFTQRLGYNEFFVKTRYSHEVDDYFSLHPYIGLAFSSLEYAKGFWEKVDVIHQGNTSHSNSSNKGSFNQSDILFLTGVDFVNSNRFVIGLEYDHGLMNISDRNNKNTVIHSQSLIMNIGFKFGPANRQGNRFQLTSDSLYSNSTWY